MQFSYIYALLALAPSLAMANPIAVASIDAPDSSHLLTKRGIDICPPQYGRVGAACKGDAGDNSAHACDNAEAPVIVSLTARLLPKLPHGRP